MSKNKSHVSPFIRPYRGLPILAYAYGFIVIAVLVTYSILGLTRVTYDDLVGVSGAIAPISQYAALQWALALGILAGMIAGNPRFLAGVFIVVVAHGILNSVTVVAFGLADGGGEAFGRVLINVVVFVVPAASLTVVLWELEGWLQKAEHQAQGAKSEEQLETPDFVFDAKRKESE